MNYYWAYLHSNGSVQLKRWFGDVKDYTDDCIGNDFVLEVIKPFKADSNTEALNFVTDTLEKKGYKLC